MNYFFIANAPRSKKKNAMVPFSIYSSSLEDPTHTMSNNQFSVEIRNYNKQYYTFRIIVKKPNSAIYIKNFIEEIISKSIK